MPHYKLELSHPTPHLVCGVDEAGRGPWAGPVVAAAAMFASKRDIPARVNDSKKLSHKAREALFEQICATASFGVGIATVDEIDQLNIWGATSLAMKRAVQALPQPASFALIDGNRVPKDFPIAAQAIVKGDGTSLSIAAASIIAKVTRDRMMMQLHEEFPHYGFARHMGYGTAAHNTALREHGICHAHRKSFAPIRALVEAA